MGSTALWFAVKLKATLIKFILTFSGMLEFLFKGFKTQTALRQNRPTVPKTTEESILM